jgi:predicted Zn-dependent protease
MQYENPQIPEGINVRPSQPLKELAWLASGLLIIVLVVILSLSFIAGTLARHIPFQWEAQLLDHSIDHWQQTRDRPDHEQIEGYLQLLADKLAARQQLPEGMNVKIHYFNGPMINAFASLGGHIMVFRGALEQVPNENALAMILAHEVAHVKHRDPIVAYSRAITIGLALANLVGLEGSSAVNDLVGQTNLLAQLSFTRDQESAADAEALLTLQAYYGHTEWADSFFQFIAQAKRGRNPPKFLSSHPHPEERIQQVREFRLDGPDATAAGATPLPDFVLALKSR